MLGKVDEPTVFFLNWPRAKEEIHSNEVYFRNTLSKQVVNV